MNIKEITKNNTKIAVIINTKEQIMDSQSALDLIMTVKYETGSDRIADSKEIFTEDFFRLSTGLAGEILQKFINYYIKFAVFGDLSHYTSKPLKDFIYECNNGKDIFFVSNQEEALNRLSPIV